MGSYYREPKAKLENLEELDLSLNKVHNLKPYCNMKTFLGGDFNLGGIVWDSGCSLAGARDKTHCDKLIEITQNYNLEQINETPTRQGRVLDLLFTSHPNLVQRHTVCPPIGLGDHDILSVTTSIKPTVNKKPSRTVYNYRKADWVQIREDMASFRDQYLQSNPSSNSVEENWNEFKNALFKSMDNHIPKKTIKGKVDVPWMTNKVKRLIKKKKRLYKKARKLKDSNSTKAFHDFRKEVRNMLHTEYYRHINNLLEPESDKTSQSFWKYIKSRKQDSVSIGTLKDNGRIAENAKDKAEMFNNTFCSVFTKENLDNIPDKGQSPYQPMPRIHVTLNGVIKCVKRLNPKKASGPDKMPILALQETINETAPVLQSIFQQSLDQSEIPSDWKKADL